MNTCERGFTLIELLIAVAIIGILAVLLIPNAMKGIQNAKIRATQKDVGTIATILVSYITDKTVLPANNGDIGDALKTALAPMYVKVLPLQDQWGMNFKVFTGTNVNGQYGVTGASDDDFLVASYGRGGALESWSYNPAAPEAGLFTIANSADFEKDLVNLNGAFIRGPRVAPAGT